MPLNDMNLQAMARLADDIDAVRAAMAILADRGLASFADLTPGQPMAIRLQCRMGDVSHLVLFGEGEAVLPAAPQVAPLPLPDTDPAYAAMLDSIADQVAEATGIRDASLGQAPAGPTWTAWTDDQTNMLIDQVALRMEFHGQSLRAAAADMAEQIGRPVEGTVYKARSLVERIEARRRELAAEAVPEPQPAVMPPAVTSDPGGENVRAPEVATPALAPATPFGEQIAYLRDLPRKRGWTVERDYDVVRLAELGWKPAEIALELAIPADELKPRFAMLTRQGTYKRADVMAALTAMLSDPVSGEAA